MRRFIAAAFVSCALTVLAGESALLALGIISLDVTRVTVVVIAAILIANNVVGMSWMHGRKE